MTMHDPQSNAQTQARFMVEAARPDQIERLLREIRTLQPELKKEADA